MSCCGDTHVSCSQRETARKRFHQNLKIFRRAAKIFPQNLRRLHSTDADEVRNVFFVSIAEVSSENIHLMVIRILSRGCPTRFPMSTNWKQKKRRCRYFLRRFSSNDGVTMEMGRLGWTLSTFPAEELFLGNGGVHCMTCPLLVC